MIRLGILLSGRGSNFVAIANHIAGGKLAARSPSSSATVPRLPASPRRRPGDSRPWSCPARDARARSTTGPSSPPCIRPEPAGGARRIPAPALALVRAAFPGKILNIHPSLLPAFPGLEAQRQALDYGVRVSGCTVHFVDEHLDHGAIILQKTVPVLPSDDEHTLAERILTQEHQAYSEAIALVASGGYRIQGRRVLLLDS